MTGRLRVVIAEDHFLFREGIRQLLESSGRAEVVASVGDASSLLEAVRRLDPDVAVVDIRMPPDHRTEGIEAARRIRLQFSSTGVVVLSQYANTLYAFELFREGTAGLGYLLKDRVGDLDDLLRALVTVSAGGSVIDPVVVEGLLTDRNPRRPDALGELTDREREALALMAEGRSNGAIADAMFVSQSAVEKHIGSLFQKLGLDAEDVGVNRRVAAVLAYLQTYDPYEA